MRLDFDSPEHESELTTSEVTATNSAGKVRGRHRAILTEPEHSVYPIGTDVNVESERVSCILYDPARGFATKQPDMSSDGATRGLIMVVEDESAIADVIR